MHKPQGRSDADTLAQVVQLRTFRRDDPAVHGTGARRGMSGANEPHRSGDRLPELRVRPLVAHIRGASNRLDRRPPGARSSTAVEWPFVRWSPSGSRSSIARPPSCTSRPPTSAGAGRGARCCSIRRSAGTSTRPRHRPAQLGRAPRAGGVRVPPRFFLSPRLISHQSRPSASPKCSSALGVSPPLSCGDSESCSTRRSSTCTSRGHGLNAELLWSTTC